jgi:hypothetical protein
MWRATNCSLSLSWNSSPSHPPSHKATGDRYAEASVILREDLRYGIVSD